MMIWIHWMRWRNDTTNSTSKLLNKNVSKRKNKLKTFTETSNISYDRHTYKVHLSDGRYKHFDDYEQMRAFWMQTNQLYGLSHVEVLDTSQ